MNFKIVDAVNLFDKKTLLNKVNALSESKLINSFNEYVNANKFSTNQIKICGCMCLVPCDFMDVLSIQAFDTNVFKLTDVANDLRMFFVESINSLDDIDVLNDIKTAIQAA